MSLLSAHFTFNPIDCNSLYSKGAIFTYLNELLDYSIARFKASLWSND